MSGSEPSTTVLCGSLSLHPVMLGARMHRAGYVALGLDFAYVPFKVGPDDLAGALGGMRALGIRGFGVSMPFKLQVIPLLDAVDPLAGRIGAVNTIVNDAGRLTGHNTDAWGAARALEEVIPLSGKRVAVLGAGGAARAVAFSLVSEGVDVCLANRTASRAAELADSLRAELGQDVPHGGFESLGDLHGIDALVNASSAGMSEYGVEPPIPADFIHNDLVVMDIVYKPLETELLKEARRKGATVVHGGRMLLHQACRQFELYTGQKAPLDAMDRALRQAIAA